MPEEVEEEEEALPLLMLLLLLRDADMNVTSVEGVMTNSLVPAVVAVAIAAVAVAALLPVALTMNPPYGAQYCSRKSLHFWTSEEDGQAASTQARYLSE